LARVASRHHAIVRKALKRYHGNEIDNAGDGFFAAFDDQADAIRCACEISDGVKVLGIEVRAGATWVRRRWWAGNSAA
jgi:class 3 adenylate cyclase